MTSPIVRTTGALFIVLVVCGSVSALAQTDASKASAVGTWKLDAAQSDLGSEPAPRSLALTIL